MSKTEQLDLRSDTVTRPTAGMRRAMADAEVSDDVLDGDPTALRLEALVAERLGKAQALFFPTGTMANQAAIALHTRPATEVLIDGDMHIVHWELVGAAAFSGVQLRTIHGAKPVMQASDLAAAVRPIERDSIEPSLVCIENTHATAGGMVTTLAETQALRDVANTHALPLHLDGARLWNASVATGTSLDAFAACADTVMVSFSKGLGAPIGAALAGDANVMEHARRVRRRLGGGMRQSGIMAAGALYGLEHHYDRLSEDHFAAKLLATALTRVTGARVVTPDTNIVMVDFAQPVANEVAARAAELGVRVSVWTPSRIRAVTHLDAPIDAVERGAYRLAAAMEKVLR